jgi:hypothetical protein
MDAETQTKLIRWIGVTAATMATGCAVWIGAAVQQMQLDVAEVRSRVEMIRPNEILSALGGLEVWRQSVERRIDQLERPKSRWDE